MIHSTAIIDPGATIADDVYIGPYSIVGAGVNIGAGSRVESHVVIQGPTDIGRDNHIFQFATVGEAPPDKKYKGEDTRLVIGNNNTIREGVTIHRGTVQDRSETTIGDNNLLMAYVHIAHDCVIGNNCILANNATLGGHVHIGDWVQLSGYSLVHQFCRVGEHAFTGMGTAVGMDVPAYVLVMGAPAEAKSINSEGLKRRGFEKETIAQINKAYKTLYRRSLTLGQALAELEQQAAYCPELNLLIASLKASTRGIVR